MTTIDAMKLALQFLKNGEYADLPAVVNALNSAIAAEEAHTAEPAKPTVREACEAQGIVFRTEFEAKPSAGDREWMISTLRDNGSRLSEVAADMLAADALEIEELESDYADQVLRAMKAEEALAQQVAVPQGLRSLVEKWDKDSSRSTPADAMLINKCIRELSALIAAPQPPLHKSGDAHEIWAAAQLVPGEGIEDGVARVEALLGAPLVPMTPDEIFRMYGSLPPANDVVVAIVRATEAHYDIGVKL